MWSSAEWVNMVNLDIALHFHIIMCYYFYFVEVLNIMSYSMVRLVLENMKITLTIMLMPWIMPNVKAWQIYCIVCFEAEPMPYFIYAVIMSSFKVLHV